MICSLIIESINLFNTESFFGFTMFWWNCPLSEKFNFSAVQLILMTICLHIMIYLYFYPYLYPYFHLYLYLNLYLYLYHCPINVVLMIICMHVMVKVMWPNYHFLCSSRPLYPRDGYMYRQPSYSPQNVEQTTRDLTTKMWLAGIEENSFQW